MTNDSIPNEQFDISEEDIETERPTEQDEDRDEGGEGAQDTGDDA
jgi:hypothetical protein